MSLQAKYSSRRSAGVNNPGKLDRRVSLQAFITVQDSLGAASRVWVTLAQVWASRRPSSSRRFFAEDSKHAETVFIYRIRHRSDVTTFMRLVHGDDTFEIIGSDELGRRHMLDLTCRAVDQTTESLASVRPTFQTDAAGNVLTDENGVALRSN